MAAAKKDSLQILDRIYEYRDKYDLDIKLQSIGKYMLKTPMDSMSDVLDMFYKIYQYGNDVVKQ